ncbi:MAG: hypothetical protein M3Q27_17525 [Actinomycetota bacterium]|nr:hypothetical protein [Actinomycetota bacterium]
MTEQRIDHAAAQVVTTGDADPSEGQGLASPGVHAGALGGDVTDKGDITTSDDEGREPGQHIDSADGDTEGERVLRAVQQRQQG